MNNLVSVFTACLCHLRYLHFGPHLFYLPFLYLWISSCLPVYWTLHALKSCFLIPLCIWVHIWVQAFGSVLISVHTVETEISHPILGSDGIGWFQPHQFTIATAVFREHFFTAFRCMKIFNLFSASVIFHINFTLHWELPLGNQTTTLFLSMLQLLIFL